MNLDELKSKVANYQDWLNSSNGIARFSPSGPASMPMIHALVAALEEQSERIDQLEKRLADK